MTAVRYRVLWGPGRPLADLLREGITSFYRDHRRLPAEIVVNRTAVAAATAALQALELHIPVRGCAGCLLGEVWLKVNEEAAQSSVP